MRELSEDKETSVSILQSAVTGVAVIDGEQNELLFEERWGVVVDEKVDVPNGSCQDDGV